VGDGVEASRYRLEQLVKRLAAGGVDEVPAGGGGRHGGSISLGVVAGQVLPAKHMHHPPRPHRAHRPDRPEAGSSWLPASGAKWRLRSFSDCEVRVSYSDGDQVLLAGRGRVEGVFPAERGGGAGGTGGPEQAGAGEEEDR